MRVPPPNGYRRFLVLGAEVVGRAELLDALRAALGAGSFYAYAAKHPQARSLAGRGTAYAVPLDRTDTRIVVRHNRHGGLLAPLTGDRFLVPTRAPYELDVSLRLTTLGIDTPPVLGYAIYQAGGILRRSDVITREIPNSRDLADVLVHADGGSRRVALDTAARLVGRASAVGVRHHDLNAKNILLADEPEREEPRAYLLDVDRVTFHAPGDIGVLERNLERFVRSARKWRDRSGARIEEEDLDRFALIARETLYAREEPSTRS
jgi:hypothetical protein